MGCAASQEKKRMEDFDGTRKPRRKTERGIKLNSCKVELTAHQLNHINHKFYRILEQANSKEIADRQLTRLSGVVERLVQRLVSTAGHLDPRFASKFLININPTHTKSEGSRLKFRYLVRLDALSTPALYLESPPVRVLQGTGRDTLPAGYARIRVLGEYLQLWGDFINHHGYLRRDKIQGRFMELLATAAGQPGHPFSPKDVDESRLCGAPGKVVDALTLHQILKLNPEHQFYYGAAECDDARYPDPRDFRIAIVEGVPEVRLHIAFLSPAANALAAADDAEVILTVCVAVDDWPQQSDFPSRLPLDHPDVLLALKAAQTGYILVPCGPHHTVRCEDRTSIWEIRIPAAEVMLLDHYSTTSVVARCGRLLNILMHLLRSRGVKTINSYILQTLLWWEMERKCRLEDWTPSFMTHRVVSILDTLAVCLRHQHLRSYFFLSVNLLLQPCVAEEDYCSDADIIETYISQCHYDRSSFEPLNSEISVQDQLEAAMIVKWRYIINNLEPNYLPRSRRRSFENKTSIRYSRRQMEYIALLFREILKLRQIQQAQRVTAAQVTTPSYDHLDEFFYLLQSVFEQAKSQAWNHAGGEAKRRMRDMMDTYDVSTAMMIDGIKRDGSLRKHFENDMQLVAKVIECLHAAADSDCKVMGSILIPYLDQLFKGSHENCWFISEWMKHADSSEFEAIGAYSRLVLKERLDPLQGLLDCVSKGWNWAKHALYMLKAVSDEHSAQVLLGTKTDSSSSGLRLVFTPSPDQTLQCNLSLTEGQCQEVDDFLQETQGRTPLSTLKKGRKSDSRYATISSFPNTLYDNGELTSKKADTWSKLRMWSDKLPPHGKLRDGSPLTVVSMATRRQGTHRGLGSIVQGLISLHKLTVLREIAIHLPEEERGRVLGDIQKLSKEVERMSVSRRRSEGADRESRFSFRRSPKKAKIGKNMLSKSATLPNSVRRSKVQEEPPREAYTSRNEFQQEQETKQRKVETEMMKMKEDSLLGTCRLLRINNRISIDKIEYYGTVRRYENFGKKSMSTSSTFLSSPYYIKKPPQAIKELHRSEV